MGDGNLDYAERLRIELMGATHRIWHRSFGQDRGEVALTAVGVDPAGSRSRVLWSPSQSVPPALLEQATPCETARWVADRYNEEAELLAQHCFQILQHNPLMRYPEDTCRSAVDHAGLPAASNWPTDPDSLLDTIRDWANPPGPAATLTQPGTPAHTDTDRQRGTPLREFLDIHCQQPG